ncbi:outer-membrane lipoprotein carrier protein LolA [Candidatus Pelagibacter sp.]|uniref:outer-membrane lipoprotein carrier protein LolA n=1 Tax=Candidatus Pelagibacter sp. TaxID=2024849 RepID=UPI003D11D705
MLKFILLIFLFSLSNQVYANNKNQIINKLKNTSNLNFDFEQNINGKIELGNCTIQYPKKIFCKYNKKNKIIVSSGKSLYIKTISSYYRYPLNKTPLNFILDKNFLLKKIYELNEEIVNNSLVKFTIKENNQSIEIFFDIDNYNLIGWQTKDIYQNTAITLLYSIKSNQIIDQKIFKAPTLN